MTIRMEHVYWVSVIVLIAPAIFLMVDGEILGESTTGIAVHVIAEGAVKVLLP